MSDYAECPKCYGPGIRGTCKDCGFDPEADLRAALSREKARADREYARAERQKALREQCETASYAAHARAGRAEAALRRLEECAPDPAWVLTAAMEEDADPPQMIVSAIRDYREALAGARAALSGSAGPEGDRT